MTSASTFRVCSVSTIPVGEVAGRGARDRCEIQKAPTAMPSAKQAARATSGNRDSPRNWLGIVRQGNVGDPPGTDLGSVECGRRNMIGNCQRVGGMARKSGKVPGDPGTKHGEVLLLMMGALIAQAMGS